MTSSVQGSKQRTPQEWWSRAGETLDPVDYNGRAALIACSATLAEQVVAVLRRAEVPAQVGQVRRISPNAQVLGVQAGKGEQELLVPLIPRATTLHAYRFADTSIDEPLPTPVHELTVPTGSDGWPDMHDLAQQLLPLLGVTPPKL
ncbi:hypothetical protein GCM10010174_88290 [Kutzneria viridogrisea]|uniref:Uncharacterized protein n=1 Tax=Kutzneria viridogrisea TaxID=47990 RepID=A0ABR6BZH5_9PSEU|nr:hypothetical protein [Kutzneria viridogrisea]